MPKPVRRRRRPARRQSRGQRIIRPASDRALRQSVDALDRQLRRLSEAGDKALRQLGAIRLDGAARYEEQLVRKAVRDGLFSDLAALEPAIAAAGASTEGLSSFRGVPAALLIWASSELHLEPILKVGDEGEMPGGAAGKYDWNGDAPSDPREIVAFRVVDPGWKWRGQVLARPRLSRK
jgi:hypothetical protein